MRRSVWGLAAGAAMLLALTGCETSKQACEREKRYNARIDEIQMEMDGSLDRVYGEVASLRSSPAVVVQPAPAPIAPMPAGDIIYTSDPSGRAPEIVWTPPPAPAPKPATTSLAAKHIRINQPVSRVQSALREYGSYNGAIDGKVGKQTIAAIQEFQRGNGLVADGIVGRATWAKLEPYAPATGGAAPVRYK